MSARSNRPSPAHRTAYSAGGVIFRVVDQQIEVALIATDRGGRWGLPKGHVQRGETAEAAALREVAEETGLDGAIVCHLATIEYWFRAGSARVHKYVDLFLIRYESGEVRPQIAEVDDARWVPLTDALTMVSFERERDVLAQVCALLDQDAGNSS
ncbi:MAG: NUDIX hydrolase [Oscillochloridaceae bacterium umkhey_bin13]